MERANRHATLLLGVLIGLVLGIVVGMWSPPSQFKEPEACTSAAFWCWVNNWQTLITGILAVAIAYAGLRPVINNARRENRLETQSANAQLARIQSWCIRNDYGYFERLKSSRTKEGIHGSINDPDLQSSRLKAQLVRGLIARDAANALEKVAEVIELDIPEVHRAELQPVTEDLAKCIISIGSAASGLAQCFADKVTSSKNDLDFAAELADFDITIDQPETAKAIDVLGNRIEQAIVAATNLRDKAEALSRE